MRQHDVGAWIAHLLRSWRPASLSADLEQSQRAIERANRAADAWNQHIADGLAMSAERQFWGRSEHEPPDHVADDC